MVSIGLITEGITDQIIIEHLLAIYFESEELNIRILQPLRDETDIAKQGNTGNWLKVFEYCSSENLLDSLNFIDYVIIQIDTDVCEEINFGISRIEQGHILTDAELFDKVKEKIISKFPKNLLENYLNNIVFAICINSIECWLLPLYYNDKKKYKVVNCLNTLNQALEGVEGFTIDKNKKNYGDYYSIIANKYGKKSKIITKSLFNYSFTKFVESISKININL